LLLKKLFTQEETQIWSSVTIVIKEFYLWLQLLTKNTDYLFEIFDHSLKSSLASWNLFNKDQIGYNHKNEWGVIKSS
jgi:hypothetical protein